MPIALGIVRSLTAIRDIQPNARILHVEAATSARTDRQDLHERAQLLTDVGWLPTDLVLGPRHGRAPHAALAAGARRPRALPGLVVTHGTAPDLMGVNYYPDLTPRRLVETRDGVVQVSYDRGALGLRGALTGFHDCYDLPLLVAETSVEGDDSRRGRWLVDSVPEVHQLTAGGLDVRGYTWWPMFDFIDWSWAAGGANVEEFAVGPPRTGRRRRGRTCTPSVTPPTAGRRSCGAWGSSVRKRVSVAPSSGS